MAPTPSVVPLSDIMVVATDVDVLWSAVEVSVSVDDRARLVPSRVEASMVETWDVAKVFSVLGSLVDEMPTAWVLDAVSSVVGLVLCILAESETDDISVEGITVGVLAPLVLESNPVVTGTPDVPSTVIVSEV